MSLAKDESRNQQLLPTDREESASMSKCPKTWKVAVVLLFVCALFLVGVIVGFYISQAYESFRTRPGSAPGSYRADGQAESTGLVDDPVYLSKLHDTVIDFFPSEGRAFGNLEQYVNLQLNSGSEHDDELVKLLQQHFNASKFDDLTTEEYEVLISLPNPEKPSQLLAFSKDNNQTIVDVDFQSRSKPGIVPGYVAYSPADKVQGELVYLNRGTLDDYSRVDNKRLQGKIGLVRTGQTTLEDKVRLAECHGLIGLLLFEDSAELHHHSKNHLCSDVTPQAVFRVRAGGDPLTPSFPAIDGMWRISVTEAQLPKIPVQTLSCEAAKSLLHHLRLNGTLHTSDDSQVIVQLEVNNQLLLKPIQNVIATLFGDKDSDYSILVGASRNSFSSGLLGGIPGTDILLQVSSAISQLFHNQKYPWIPRRTIRFVSWGGAEFGYLGFTEFLEKYRYTWKNKVVAFIDLDNPVKETKSKGSEVSEQIVITSSASVEVLTEMIVEQLRATDKSIPETVWQSITKKVAAPSHDLQDISPMTILRKHLPTAYIHVQITESTDEIDSVPEESESAYIVGHVAALLTLTLADSGVFQFQVHRSAQEMNADMNRFISSFSSVLPNVTIEALRSHSKHLRKSALDLEDYIHRHLEYNRPEDVRMVNSILLQMDAEMTSVQADIAEIQVQYHKNRDRHVVAHDHCTDLRYSEFWLAVGVSELLSRIMAATKVTDLAG